jgi:hypothetical protein
MVSNSLPPVVHTVTEAHIVGRRHLGEKPLPKVGPPTLSAIRDNIVTLSRGAALSSIEVMGDRMNDFTREEIDAKIQKSVAETETKIVRVEGKIDTLGTSLAGKIDALASDVRNLAIDVDKSESYNRESRLIIVSTIAAAVIAFGALIIGMATYGDALFGRGMNVRDVIQTTIKETMEQMKKAEGHNVPSNH